MVVKPINCNRRYGRRRWSAGIQSQASLPSTAACKASGSLKARETNQKCLPSSHLRCLMKTDHLPRQARDKHKLKSIQTFNVVCLRLRLCFTLTQGWKRRPAGS